MQKFKQAIPTRDQGKGFETDVVGRAFMFARDAGLAPITAWLQYESNEDRTIVSVVVPFKAKEAVELLLQIPKRKATAKLWSMALPFRRDTFCNDRLVQFGDAGSALVVKRSSKESIVIFRTFQ